MTLISKELIEVENSVLATFSKLSRQMLFPHTCLLQEDLTLKLKLG